jgi:hypothetical protein
MSDMNSTSHSDHNGMTMMHGYMDMSQMLMVFFTATSTPLYSNSWTPSNAGEYAGTCIFLIVLAVILRALVALRTNFDGLWAQGERRRDVDLLRREEEVAAAGKGEEGMIMPPRPTAVGNGKGRWSVKEAAARAGVDTVLAGVSYLL